MPRRKNPVPKYSLHKATNQARCRIHGKDYYLGEYQSPQSLERYAELLKSLAGQTDPNPNRKAKPKVVVKKRISIAELAERYLEYLQEKHRRREAGRLTSRKSQSRRLLGLLVQKFGTEQAEQFGPQKLSALRCDLIGMGWSRPYINGSIRIILDCWRWAAGLAELVPAEVASRLLLFPPLAPLESDAREHNTILPAEETAIAAAKEHLSPILCAMIDLQLCTGMRPGEVVLMRPCDVDTSGTIPLPEGGSRTVEGIWVYRPFRHKTTHLGHDRVVLLGPRAQELLKPYLSRSPEAFCFSPFESYQWSMEQRRQRRKTKVWDSHQRRIEKKRIDLQSRPRGDRYCSGSYSRAVSRAIELANRKESVPSWSPHQLRHNAATRLAAEFGPEIARIVLGHRTLSVTRIYVADDLRRAAEAQKKAG